MKRNIRLFFYLCMVSGLFGIVVESGSMGIISSFVVYYLGASTFLLFIYCLVVIFSFLFED